MRVCVRVCVPAFAEKDICAFNNRRRAKAGGTQLAGIRFLVLVWGGGGVRDGDGVK